VKLIDATTIFIRVCSMWHNY